MCIEWLFFDVGNTLVDESKAYETRLREAAALIGKPYELIQEEALDFYRQNDKGDLAVMDKYGIPKPKWPKEDERLYPETVEVLKALKAKYKIGVIANQSLGTAARLQAWGILQFIDLVIASAEEGVSKPDPRIFEIALGRADCKAEHAVMIGDRIDNDVVPAKKMGMKTVWIRQGGGGLWQLQGPEQQPDFTVDNLGELVKIFLEISGRCGRRLSPLERVAEDRLRAAGRGRLSPPKRRNMTTNPEMLYTAKIEQTWDYPKRMKYIAEIDSFIAKDYDSLSYYRNFHQPYGWIKESGTPPCEHLDVIVMTDGHFELGDEVLVRVIGVFKRDDGDYKLVSVLKERNVQELSELEKSEIEDLNRLYKPLSSEEGWFGKDCAKEIIEEFQRTKKRKIIYTVQHTESEHHVNGHIGAWGNWNLTEHGREQAHNLGEWLGNYGDCKHSFKMYASDLNRASQTADEIQKVLEMPDSSVTKTPLLREINLGSGNGQTREWYNTHVAKPPKIYNPDFRSFPDAENDREMWARLHKFYEELMDSDDERIIIVSHGGALGFLNAMIMGDSFEDTQRRKINGHAGAVNRFVVESDGSVEISYLNIWVC